LVDVVSYIMQILNCTCNYMVVASWMKGEHLSLMIWLINKKMRSSGQFSLAGTSA